MTLDTARTASDSVAAHVSDHNTLHRFHNAWGTFYQAQFIDPANGSDSNSGDNPGEAKATIEAAYGDVSKGGALILAPAQRHDVGTGLSLDRQKEVSIFAPYPRGRRYRSPTGQSTYPENEAVIYSSTGASTLIDFADPAATLANGNGFVFQSVVFEMSATTDIALDANSVTHLLVDDCFFWSKNSSSSTIAVKSYHDDVLGNDHSWGRIINSNVVHCQIFNGTGGNTNQWVIRDNVAFGTGEASGMTAITLTGAHRCVVRDNNLEQYQVGVSVGASDNVTWGCEFAGNGGESVGTLYDVVKAAACLFTGPGISTADSSEVYIAFSADSANNIAVVPGRVSPNGSGSPYVADTITDANGSNMIITSLQIEDSGTVLT